MSYEDLFKYAPKPRALKNGKQYTVFLSFGTVNRSWVTALYDVLVQAGHSVFLDQKELVSNQNLQQSIEDVSVQSQAGILVWSNDAQDNQWVRDEYEVLSDRAKAEKDFFFVPIKLDDTPLPPMANSQLFLDFSDYPDGPNGRELLRLLHVIVGEPLSIAAMRYSEQLSNIARRTETSTTELEIQNNLETKSTELVLNFEILSNIPFSLENHYWLERLTIMPPSNLNELHGSSKFSSTSTNLGLQNLKGIESLENLKSIEIANWRELNDFEALSELKKLRHINLSGTNFTENDIQYLNTLFLENLNLSYTECKLSDSINAPNLTSLNLSNCNLKNAPITSAYQQLSFIDFSRNKLITTIPENAFLGNAKLKSINLSHTNISNIEFINPANSLESLDVSHTNISSLEPIYDWLLVKEPQIIADRLHSSSSPSSKLYLNNCHSLESPSYRIANLGLESILNYFDEMVQSRKINITDYVNKEARILVIGNSTTGKSHLTTALRNTKISNRKNEFKNISSTHGLIKSKWNLSSDLYKNSYLQDPDISVIDFGGQDYYHHCHPLYFDDRTCYLLVWDAYTNTNSTLKTNINFNTENNITQNITHYSVEYWLSSIAHFIRKRSGVEWHLEWMIKEYLKSNRPSNTLDTYEHRHVLLHDFVSDLPFIRDSTHENSKTLKASNTSFVQLEKELFNLFGNMNHELGLTEFLSSTFNAIVSERKKDIFYSTSVILVQNKIDRDGKKYLNLEKLAAEYPFIVDAISISALKDDGINVLRNYAIPKAIERLHLVGEKYPGYYRRIFQWMENHEDIQVTVKEIRQKLTNFNSSIESDKADSQIEVYNFLTAASYLGKIVWPAEYIQQHETSYDDITVFIKPYELSTLIHGVLSRDLEETNGMFSFSDIKDNIEPKYHDKLLETMENHGLIFSNHFVEKNNKFDSTKYFQKEKDDKTNHNVSNSSESTFIAPQYLSNNLPQTVRYTKSVLDQPIFQYRFHHFLHTSILLSLYSNICSRCAPTEDPQSSGNKTYLYWVEFWKDLLIVSKIDDTLLSIVELDRANQLIKVYSDKKNTETEIVDMLCSEIENVSESFEFRKEVTIDGLNFIPLDKLIQMLDSNQHEFIHEEKVHRLGDYRRFFKNHEHSLYMKRIFVSYSSRDKQFKDELLKRLRILERESLISTWHDGKILPGMKWDSTIKSAMDDSDIILLLVSPDFLHSDYIYEEEVQIALERADRDESKVVPIIIRACNWEQTKISQFQSAGKIPSKGKPIDSADNIDEAWQSVVKELTQIIQEAPTE